MRQAILVLHRKRYACEQAVGGEYYNCIAEIVSDDLMKEWTKGPQDERIIIRFKSFWVVTTKNPDDKNQKQVWVKCNTLTYAKSMRDK